MHLFTSLHAERRVTHAFIFPLMSQNYGGERKKKEKSGEKQCKIHKLLKRCFDLCLIFDFFPGFWRAVEHKRQSEIRENDAKGPGPED